MKKALIYIPNKNPMQSGIAKSSKWILEFKTKNPTKNPLMGWESSSDTLTELRLEFSSKELAVNYAKKNKTNIILRSQIIHGLKNITKNNSIIFAYEPVWSIGTGVIPKINNLEQQIYDIKNMIIKFWKLKNPKIIYGGSVNSKNISELNKISSINGFLVGGASQNSKNFIDIIKKTIN